MDKLKMHSPDLSQANIAKIRELFPGCVTEARAETTGAVRLAVDFDQLRQELSDHIVDGPQERFRLDWPGKREALIVSSAPIAASLRPSRAESVDFDSTRNLFIEGDNLDALKLLQATYLGQIKLIYIDPPYNTGKDFVYDDDFAQGSDRYLEKSLQRDADGNRLVANTSANGRFHSDWLSTGVLATASQGHRRRLFHRWATDRKRPSHHKLGKSRLEQHTSAESEKGNYPTLYERPGNPDTNHHWCGSASGAHQRT
jgi:adenine-specific DNA-methyltransferase